MQVWELIKEFVDQDKYKMFKENAINNCPKRK